MEGLCGLGPIPPKEGPKPPKVIWIGVSNWGPIGLNWGRSFSPEIYSPQINGVGKLGLEMLLENWENPGS